MNVIRILTLVIFCGTQLTDAYRKRPKGPPRKSYHRHDIIHGQKIPSWILNNPIYYRAFQDYVKSVAKIDDGSDYSYLEKFPEGQTLNPKPAFPPHPAGYYQTLDDYTPNPVNHYMSMGYPTETNNPYFGQQQVYPPKPLPLINSMPQYMPMMYNWQQPQYSVQHPNPSIPEKEISYDAPNLTDNLLSDSPPKYMLPLLMLGVGLPALGIMYIMMSGGGRSMSPQNGELAEDLVFQVQRALNFYKNINQQLPLT